MLASAIPAKFPIPWGKNAGGPYIRTIPQASQIGIQNGAASLNDGYPPLCFSPVAAGGVPPFGQDFNGINNQITAWLQWVQAGGGVPFWDSTFSAQIGGYPNGAMLQATSGPGNFWISTADNNVTNPDTGGAGWTAFPGPALVYPSRVVTTNTTVNLSCATDYSLGLNRGSPGAMTINLAATGTLILNQVFEVEDLSANLDLGFATVVPPAGHTIATAANFVMNQQRQSCRFKYYGSTLWSVRTS